MQKSPRNQKYKTEKYYKVFFIITKPY